MSEDNLKSQKNEPGFTPRINEGYHEVLKELADELIYNYLANSFGDDGYEPTDYGSILLNEEYNIARNIKWLNFPKGAKVSVGEYFNERRAQRKRCRNIVVIGAGASFDSFKEIPLGQQMIESFKKIFVDKISGIPFLKDKYDYEENEIKKLLIGHLDFENFLYLLSTFFVKQETLRQEIKEHTGFRYSPCLFYEIIAHMLKHSFLDAVINFNFDEILDQCIQDELGKDNYHFVLSDGHTLKMEEILVGGRIKAPIYIKPHGTYSHKSSLRFTKRHYLYLPPDIQDMLSGLLSGHRGKGKEVQRVNLICVGFDLASLEFNEIINKVLPPESRIYHFLHDINKTDDELKDHYKETIFTKHFNKFLDDAENSGNIFEQLYQPINLANIPAQSIQKNDSNKDDKADPDYRNRKWNSQGKNMLTSPLSEYFSVLWRQVHKRFNAFNAPRSIGRHELISYFFYDCRFAEEDHFATGQLARKAMRDFYENSPKYFKDRVMVEIAIELLRNNGNIDIIELLKGRAGHYYDRFLLNCKIFPTKIRNSNSIYDFLFEFSPEGKRGDFETKRTYPEIDNDLLQTKIIFRVGTLRVDNKEKVFAQIEKRFEKAFIKMDFEVKRRLNENTKHESQTIAVPFMKKLKDCFESFFEINELGTTVLMYLLRSDFLSSRFRDNLVKNYSKNVYNGLTWSGEKLFRTCLEEIFRIFSKTSSSSFLNIKPTMNDPTFKLWEGFEMKNIIHTNLLLSTDNKSTFNDKNWDCLLTVLETGETLKRLFKQNFEPYLDVKDTKGKDKARHFFTHLQKKTIIMLCSAESVEQIHLLKSSPNNPNKFYGRQFFTDKTAKTGKGGQTELQDIRNDPRIENIDQDYKIEILISEHKKYMCDFLSDLKEKSKDNTMLSDLGSFVDSINACLSIVLVPFWEHNQHCTIYLKSVVPDGEVYSNLKDETVVIEKTFKSIAEQAENRNDQELIEPEVYKNYSFIFQNGYHMYRRGFSHNINPVKLDSKKTTSNESYLRRDIHKILHFYFNVFCRGIAYQVQNAAQMKYPEFLIIEDVTYYRSWPLSEFSTRMDLFLEKVYLECRKKIKDFGSE